MTINGEDKAKKKEREQKLFLVEWKFFNPFMFEGKLVKRVTRKIFCLTMRIGQIVILFLFNLINQRNKLS